MEVNKKINIAMTALLELYRKEEIKTKDDVLAIIKEMKRILKGGENNES